MQENPKRVFRFWKKGKKGKVEFMTVKAVRWQWLWACHHNTNKVSLEEIQRAPATTITKPDVYLGAFVVELTTPMSVVLCYMVVNVSRLKRKISGIWSVMKELCCTGCATLSQGATPAPKIFVRSWACLIFPGR